MATKKNKTSFKKIALTLSIVALIIWGILGTGTSLAWFTDTDEEIKNVINFAEFDLEVSYRLDDGVTYVPIDSQTDIFDKDALYEPGYTQVVYLKVENKGTVPFNHQAAVILGRGCVPGTNVFGQSFNLQDYLRFGLVTAKPGEILTEDELEALIPTRKKASAYATEPLNTYHSAISYLDKGAVTYMALVVHMPEEVGNVANYRNNKPEVVLGISVTATQIKK